MELPASGRKVGEFTQEHEGVWQIISRLPKRCDSGCSAGLSSILPGCDTEYSLERFAEGGIGIVANGFGHFEQLLIGFPKQSCCLLHSPACQILQRCFSDLVLKAHRKSGTRHTG